MNKKILQYLRKLLPFIGLAIFIYLIYSLDITKIIDAFLQINPLYIIIALLLTIPLLIIRNYAWQLIQKEHNIHLSFYTSLKIFLIGYFYGSITPGYLGQLMRIPYMREKTNAPYGKLFVNSVLEVTIHTLSLYGMMVLGALLVISILPELLIITIIWLIIVLIIFFYLIKKNRGDKLFQTLIRYLIPSKLKNTFYQFINGFYIDFPKIKTMILPLILGIFTWIIMFTQEYMTVLALNMNIPYIYFLLLFPIANTAGFIPITFAGLGTRELTAIYLFSTLFQAPQEQVFVVSLMGYLIVDLFTGFIGFLFSLTETKNKQPWTI